MGWFRRSEHPEEQLSAYIDGELDARQAETVARHLAACLQCAEIVEELRGTKAMLSALPQEAPRRSFVLGPEHARVAPSAKAPARRSSFSFAPAVAATLLIGLLLVDAINLQPTSNDESAGSLAGADKTELSRQTAEDSAGGAPMPATAPQASQGTANSSAAAEAVATPAATRAGESGSSAGAGTSPATEGAPPSVPTGVPPPLTGVAPTPADPLSTFGADTRAPQPAGDGDSFADVQQPSKDDGGLSTLRLLQILAGIGFVASVFYVYVRPRLFERK